MTGEPDPQVRSLMLSIPARDDPAATSDPVRGRLAYN